MYAVIVTGGKQYQVKTGDEIYIEKLDAQAEETVTLQLLKTVNQRKSLYLPTNPKKAKREKWATDSRTPRLRLTLSTLNLLR